MDVALKSEDDRSAMRSVQVMILALPDRCAQDMGELARRTGADKLELLRWSRADLSFARLLASKVAAEPLVLPEAPRG